MQHALQLVMSAVGFKLKFVKWSMYGVSREQIASRQEDGHKMMINYECLMSTPISFYIFMHHTGILYTG